MSQADDQLKPQMYDLSNQKIEKHLQRIIKKYKITIPIQDFLQ